MKIGFYLKYPIWINPEEKGVLHCYYTDLSAAVWHIHT